MPRYAEAKALRAVRRCPALALRLEEDTRGAAPRQNLPVLSARAAADAAPWAADADAPAARPPEGGPPIQLPHAQRPDANNEKAGHPLG